MKKMSNNFLLLLMLALGSLVISSCGDDDPVIDPGVDGINVADGLYLKAGTDDPKSSAGLSAEVVEANDFKSQTRDGFNAGYMWLDAGEYTVVQVTNKEITATIGGTAETITDDGSSCDFNDYTMVTTSTDGPAFSVVTSGLYKVSHDALSNELILYNITSAGIIGNATEGGWAADTELPGTLSSTGGSWTAEKVILRSGEWKVRFNCRWGINRRSPDPNASLDEPANGYQMFTNFGGDVGNPITGGANIQQTEDGEYTVSVNWTPQSGFTLTAERTGDAPVIAFNPNDFRMAVIGDATAGAWETDRNLFHKEAGGVHTWYGVVTFAADGMWKFRGNDEWDINYGGDLTGLTLGGDNIASPGAGGYYITLSTADEGVTWTATVSDMGWAIIGDATPGAWDADTFMTADGFDMGVSTYSVNATLIDGQMKFRAGGAWDHNLGGDVTFLSTDGDNIAVTAGDYDIVLSYNGEVYSATIQ